MTDDRSSGTASSYVQRTTAPQLDDGSAAHLDARAPAVIHRTRGLGEHTRCVSCHGWRRSDNDERLRSLQSVGTAGSKGYLPVLHFDLPMCAPCTQYIRCLIHRRCTMRSGQVSPAAGDCLPPAVIPKFGQPGRHASIHCGQYSTDVCRNIAVIPPRRPRRPQASSATGLQPWTPNAGWHPARSMDRMNVRHKVPQLNN